MQGDYYNFSQGPPSGNGYAPYGGYLPYGYPLPAPAIVNNKPLEKIKKQKQRSIDGQKYEIASHSTDESIHLVRSRKTGESAPGRYDSDSKKRSQSGNSLAQQAAQLSDEAHSRQRSHSDERVMSPNVVLLNYSDSSAKKSKKKRDRKHRKYYYSDVEQVYNPQLGYQQYPQDTWMTEYPAQPGGYPQEGYYQGYGYDMAPGAPQVDCSQYPGCVPAPNSYDQGYQTQYYQEPCQPCPPPVPCQPCPPAQYPEPVYPCYDVQPASNGTLPPGAKIVAEYFLGYLDEQPSCQTEYQTQYTYQQSQASESSKEDIDIEVWEKTKKKEKPKKTATPTASSSSASSSSSSSSDTEVEKPSRSSDDLKKMKDDIIKTIQNELGNLKLDSKESIQPIFLMPKQSEQQKPIYIPRNVYVPVVRPVFVPRERIIVRPQIIHVARPVLVDRPVPIQQRPIVIERDRPVAIEKSEGGDCVETTRNVESGQEVTYHEFTQAYPNSNGEYPSSSNYQYNEHVEYEDSRRKQDSQEAKSEEAYNSKAFDSLLANSQGYTLEVLDQRISDKFEKIDQETIKARYGVDSYHYLPPGANNGTSNAEFYSQNLTSAKESNSNLYGNYTGGNIQDLYGALNSPGARNQSQFNGASLDN